MNLAAKKLGFPKNAPEKPCVCSNARDGVFIERPAQSRNGLFPAVAPGDEFAQQRVVIVGYGPAFVDALVKADSRAAWNLPGENFSRRWDVIVFRVLGVKADFHRVSPRGDGLPGKRQAVPRSDGDLQLYQIEPGASIGDGMLHLQARVHFQKKIGRASCRERGMMQWVVVSLKLK